MATIRAGPADFLGLEAQEGNSTRQITLYRPQDQCRLAVPHQPGDAPQLRFLHSARHFCIDPADTFQKGHERPAPSHRILTTDHDELFRIHP